MRQGFVRALALGALTVVVCAPVASAGAAGGGGSAPVRPAAVATPQRPLTWADVVGRLRQAGRLDPPTTTTTGGARAGVRAAGSVTTPAAAVDAAPALAVSRATGLRSGDRITVTGTGFPPGDYALLECLRSGTDPSSCDTNEITDLTPDASGTFTTTLPVHRTLRLFGERVDCATDARGCEIAALDLRSGLLALVTSRDLAFDSSVPLPTPGLTATPATLLRDGTQVAVHGTGWAPGSNVSVTQCLAASALCYSGFTDPVTVGGDGTFSTSITVRLRTNDDFGRLTDCVAAACELRAESYDAPDYFARRALAFDPSQPIPPPPTITVTPATGLHHLQQVRVQGSGFAPATTLEIRECEPSTYGSCGDYLDSLGADASGSFDVTTQVTRLVGSYDPTDTTPFDCATPGCSISVTSFTSPVALVAAAPIGFDASVAPPALPVATVSPTSDLPYRAVLAVHGTGFVPHASTFAVVCIDTANVSTCGSSYGQGGSDDHGVTDFTIAVRRRYRFGSSTELDCTDPGTTCRVEIHGSLGYERVSVPITFDPNAPIPPPAAATITPDHDLGYKQTVTLDGTDFDPGSVSVMQCGPFDFGDGESTLCFGFDELQADASGNVTGPVQVQRMLPIGPSTAIDCAVAACFLQIGSSGDQTLTIPLRFDPNAPVPPPPSLTVTPGAGLFDGQHVTVAGAHFTPGSQVGVTECRAGVTVIADGCDLSQVRVATVGADGTFSRRFVTESVLRTSDGPIDCTVRANACVLTAANAPLQQDFAAAPLSFDAPTLSVLGVGVTEGTGDMTMAPVQVMLSEPDRNPLTVHWVADAETASPGTDYTSMRGTLTIPAGATEAMIDAEVVADAIDEPTETFRIRVVDALGTKVVDSTGVVTIHDDDAAPAVSIRDTSRREDHGEAHAEVVLSAPSSRTVIVHYVTHHGSADAGSDYVRKDSRLVFLPGETRHLVRVVLVNDRVHEPTETFRVEIDRAEQARIGRGTATVTITDDD